jgi:hypothetical protein
LQRIGKCRPRAFIPFGIWLEQTGRGLLPYPDFWPEKQDARRAIGGKAKAFPNDMLFGDRRRLRGNRRRKGKSQQACAQGSQ